MFVNKSVRNTNFELKDKLNMNANSNPYLEKTNIGSVDHGDNVLDILKEIDGYIDFSKGEVQWKILLHLSTKGPSSIAEISAGIAESRKTVSDAIRKLLMKGLVERVKYDIYNLSDQGRQLLKKLNSLIMAEQPVQQAQKVQQEELINESATQYYYELEIIRAAMLNNGMVPVKKLMLDLGISYKTLKNYIDLLLSKKLLKKVNKNNIFGKTIQVYELTAEGRKFGYRLPGMAKMRNNIFWKILLTITYSAKLESAMIKLMVAFSLTAPIVLYFKDSPWDKIAGAIWLYCLIFTMLLGIMGYVMMRG